MSALAVRGGAFLHGLATDFFLAYRNVARQGHRSLVAMGAIIAGVALYMLAAGFIDWSLRMGREWTIRAHLGHLQVAKPGYFESGAADPWAFLIDPQVDVEGALRGSREITETAPRLSFSGLVSLGDATLSFFGEGVDPRREGGLARAVVIERGQPLDANDPRGVILGQGLALNLGAKVGDTVVLLATTRTGGVNAVEARVRGLFSTVTKAYDDYALRAPIGLVQELLRASGAHKWLVLLNETEATPEVLARLRPRLEALGLEIVPWFQLADFYNKTAALFKRQVGFVKLIIAVIIVLSISNVLTMSVLERTWEIGTALALGAKRRQIMQRFVGEGLLIGLAGGGLGALLGAVAAAVISAVGIPMPPAPGMGRGYTAEIAVSWSLTADAALLALVTAFFASLYPAWKAASLPIVDALRHSR